MRGYSFRRLLITFCLSLLLIVPFLQTAPGVRAAAALTPQSDCDRALFDQLAGKLIDAADLLDSSLKTMLADPAVDQLDLGTCGLYHALLLHSANDFAGALASYTIARDAFLKADDAQMLWTARYGIAAILMAQGRGDQAEAELEQALTLARTKACWLPSDIQAVAEAATLNNLGVVRALAGRLKEADPPLAESARLFAALAAQAPPPADPAAANQPAMGDVLGTLDGLLNGEAQDGSSPDPAELLELIESLSSSGAADQAPPDPNADPAAILDLLSGMTAAGSAECKGASQISALMSRMILGDKIGPQIAQLIAPLPLNNRGEVARMAGDLESASQLIGSARAQLEVAESSSGTFRAAPARVLAAAAEHNLGMIAYDRKEYRAALDHFLAAEQRLRAYGQTRGLAAVLIQIGYTEQLLGNDSSAGERYAEAMDLLDAVQAVDDGSATSVAIGAGAAAGPSSALSLGGSLAPFADVYNLATALAFRQGDIPAAFASAERGRARLFLDMLRSAELRADNPRAASLLEQARRDALLLQALSDQSQQIAALDPPDPDLAATNREQIAKAQQRYAATLAALDQVDPRLGQLITLSEDTLSLAQVQQLLDPDTTLLSYYQFDPRTPGVTGALAFVITRERVDALPLPAATGPTIEAAWNNPALWVDLSNLHPQPLSDLYAALIAPLRSKLTTPLLGIVPHQQLHYVPFAALSDGKSYLGADFTLFQLPSASVLPLIRANDADTPQASPQAIIFGNPTSSNPDLLALRFAAAEASDLGALLGQPDYTRDEASEARLRAAAPSATLLHLAAHGLYDPQRPLDSAIYLAPAGKEDGALTAREILTLNLRQSTLVTLSACETNRGELSTGDEIVGLTRSFFTAGAPAVISSLWAVDDRATGELMRAFYQAWQGQGMGRAEALRAAQEQLRRDPNFASPYYWAAFSLNGDPSAGKVRFSLASPTPSPVPAATPPPTAAPGQTPLAAGGAAQPQATSAPPGSGAALCALVLILPSSMLFALRRRLGRRLRRQ